MRVRWTIDRPLDGDPEGSVYLFLVDADGTTVGGHGETRCVDLAQAKRLAERAAESFAALRWQAAPDDWQPDTYLVSQFYDDPTRG